MLTIAIPVYERDEYFEAALDSALKQTVPCPIVVVDNGSSHDRFLEIIKSKKSDRVRFFKNSSNVGMFANWNLCMDYADTDFVMILGDDDYVESTYVEDFEGALRNYPSIDLYYTAIRWFSDTPTEFPDYVIPYGVLSGKVMLEYAAQFGLGIPTTSMCIRRSVFQRHRFVEAPHGNSDWLLVYTAFSDSIIYGNDQLLAHYRKHPKSDTSSGDTAFITALSCVYIYWKIRETLGRMRSPAAAHRAECKARELTINLAINFGKKYKDFIRGEADNNFYANFVRDTILTRFFLARRLTVASTRTFPAWRFIARIRRKGRSVFGVI
ncbi:glycosyltransferase family 2 protein [Paraburkholderia sp. GAS348]|uniref:glycosyltransferase family 2 protein n=1 Tax=Paraburkholderia sp. GAS348 TaxID=3035132 RepID=UPI003D1B66EA